MFIVGLTGGIGSGKSQAAARFAALGVPVIDADQHTQMWLARQATQQYMRQLFGPQAFTDAKQINKSYLRAQIFQHPDLKGQWEAYLHLRIRRSMRCQTHKCAAPYVVWVVPLLIENQLHRIVDRVLVVDVDAATQHKRVAVRDNLPATLIQAIIDQQCPRATRLSHADDVIDNKGSLHELAQQTEKLHHLYLHLAKPK